MPLKEPGRKATVRRLVSVVVGKKPVTGESRHIAFARARKALEEIAFGKQPKLPGETNK